MKIEPVTKEQLSSLIQGVGHLGSMIARLYEVDLSKGRGILDGDDRCLWTKDGKKITIVLITGGGFVASCEK